MSRSVVFRRLQARFRENRFRLFEKMLRTVLSRKDEVQVLDVGGLPDYWMMLPEDLRPRVRITCLNLADQVSKAKSVASGLRLQMVAGDACHMPEFADGSFDLAHSNSVIEHVGSFQNMLRFAREVRRVGRGYFVQTPNYWFPVDPHYNFPGVHWLSDNTRIRVFSSMTLGYARKCSFEEALFRVDHTRIVSPFLMRKFFPDAHIRTERVLLLPKSTLAIRSEPT